MNQKKKFICYYKEKYNKFKKENSVNIYLEKNKKILFKNNYNIKSANIRNNRQKVFCLIISFLENLALSNNINELDNIIIIMRDKYILKDLKGEKQNFNIRKSSYEDCKKKFISHENWDVVYNETYKQNLKRISKKRNNINVVKQLRELDKSYVNIVSFDLEMNYISLEDKNITETISIGAVKYNILTEEIETFYSLIKPQFCNQLHDKIIELTNITQDEIDGAKNFNVVMNKFSKWMGDSKSIYLSWGMADIKVLESDNLINRNKIKIVNDMIKNYVDFQAEFCINIHSKTAMGLVNALKFCEIEFRGELHNALDDAKNLHSIVIDFIEKERLTHEV